jgi:hypothetical protein
MDLTMPFDGACVVCGEEAVLIARYGTEIEEGLCKDCAAVERLNPKGHADEVLFVQPEEEAVSDE